MMAILIKSREKMARMYPLLNESYHGLMRSIFPLAYGNKGGLWDIIITMQDKQKHV